MCLLWYCVSGAVYRQTRWWVDIIRTIVITLYCGFSCDVSEEMKQLFTEMLTLNSSKPTPTLNTARPLSHLIRHALV